MVITSIVQSLLPSYLPRWGLRSMWELAAVLNFHHVPGFGNDLSSGNPSSYSHCARAFKLGYSTLQQVKIGGTVYYSKEMISWNGYSNGHLPQVTDGEIPIIASHGHSTLAKKGLVIINMGFLIGILINFMVKMIQLLAIHCTVKLDRLRKRQCSAVNVVRRSVIGRPDVSTNGLANDDDIVGAVYDEEYLRSQKQ
ncbi:atp-dependent rna helicase [Musa troglodytarum]|uniref:Atp-dependent rna helicase n=1 Tax=Musa troglodytarum TaxID=320322 RepID=A0A9E7K8H4_9LILI|nr:atp-dependent rna helicase [Musa troglodytarum]